MASLIPQIMSGVTRIFHQSPIDTPMWSQAHQKEENKIINLNEFKTEIERLLSNIRGSWETHSYKFDRTIKYDFILMQFKCLR